MKELYFMVVSFVMQNPADIDRPLFVYYKPHFETYAECYSYANENNQSIYYTALKRMAEPGLQPESIYCITGEQVKQMHNYTYPPKEKLDI